MVVNIKKRHIFFSVIGLYVIVYVLAYQFQKPDIEHDPSSLPIPDPNRKPFIYDFQGERWIYKDEMDNWYVPKGHFNTQDVHGRPFNEKDVKKYLEQNVKGYKKKTYWGEQYEYDAVPHDEFDDDFEIEDPTEK